MLFRSLDAKNVDVTFARELLVVIDRLVVADDARGRLSDAVATAFREGDGDTTILMADTATQPPPLRFTERFQCPNDGTIAPVPTPQLFSFNSPRGACPQCNGFGAILEYDESLIVPYPDRSLREGAIDPWTKPRYENKRRTLAEYARKEGVSMDVAWAGLPAKNRERLLNANSRGFKGILPFLRDLEEKRYKQYLRVFLRQYQTAQECPSCHGAKLQPESLRVHVGGRNIAEVCDDPVGTLTLWLDSLALSAFDAKVASHILREAQDRARFLVDVGLNYLSLNRATRTLSGGEAQRIGLANSLGSQIGRASCRERVCYPV